MKGRLLDLSTGRNGKQRVSVEIDGDLRELFDELAETDVDIEIKKYRQKRSLDANAYAWVLITKLASRIGIKKVDVYRDLIRSIGGVSDTVCVKANAVDALRSGWQHNGIGWVSETMPSKIDGCINVVLYYGSSVYDSKQMSLLIDLLVQECKAVGIPTDTPEMIARYKETWEAKR